jgi:predicted ATPase
LLAGSPLTSFTYQKVLALLVYLAVEAGRAHEREFLVGLLWPELPEGAARTNLRQALAKLREAVGEGDPLQPFLLATRDTVQFNPASDFELDTTAFTQLLDQCQAHPHRGLDRCPACAARLAQAAALYQGSFLTGFSVADSAAFEEWAIVKREQFHRRAQEMLGRLASASERRGDEILAQHYAQRQLELDPWNEAAYRQLMRALARAGQRGAALAQFEVCRRALAEGLGAAPASETVALYEQIRASQAAPPSSAALLNWPHPASPLVGRKAELAQIVDRLANPLCRLLTLTGPGGIGKTRLALAAATEMAWTYAHGAAFVSLAPVTTAGDLSATLAQALGLSLSGLGEPDELVVRALREREMLIVLDNFEQLLAPGTGLAGVEAARESVRWLAGLILRLPTTQFLITSRERLNVLGEWLVEVPGLTYPVEAAAVPEPSDAEELFAQCARRVAPAFELTPDLLPAVARICRLVAGTPLALELAAAWVRLLTCAEIVAELEHGLGLLEGPQTAVNERHHSLRAVFDHSWRLLTAEEQRAYRCLAVFRGGFEREAAAAVAGVSLPLLAALVDKSLVQRIGNERFDLHPLSQQYAREQLVVALEETAARDRHADHYLGLAERSEPALRGSEQPAWLTRLEAEHDNLRAALEWTSRHNHETGLRLSGALWRFWQMRGHLHEGLQWLRRALAQPGPPAARAKALRGAAALAWRQGRFATAHALAQESVDHWRRVDDSSGLAEALTALGMAVGYEGDHAAAQAALEESARLLRTAGDAWRLALALFHLADSVAVPRTPDEARKMLEESLALFRETGDRWGIAQPLHGLGDVAYQTGDYEAARQRLEEALHLRREVGDRWLTAQTLNILGEVARCQGDYRRAETHYQESRRLYMELNAPGRVAMADHNLAYAALRRGHPEHAQALFAKSMAAFRTLDDLWGVAACLEGLAALQTDPERAARLFGAAESLREAMHAHPMPADRIEYQRNVEALRARLNEDDLATAWTAGRTLSLEEAIAETGK